MIDSSMKNKELLEKEIEFDSNDTDGNLWESYWFPRRNFKL